jgi:predicted GIY-YIG superfamily endonuclease
MAFHVMFFPSLQMHQYGLMVFLVHDENYISKPWVMKKSSKVKRRSRPKKEALSQLKNT